jgi:hypothetical protein
LDDKLPFIPENSPECALVESIPYQPDPQPFSSTSADRKSNRPLIKGAPMNKKNKEQLSQKKDQM